MTSDEYECPYCRVFIPVDEIIDATCPNCGSYLEEFFDEN